MKHYNVEGYVRHKKENENEKRKRRQKIRYDMYVRTYGT